MARVQLDSRNMPGLQPSARHEMSRSIGLLGTIIAALVSWEQWHSVLWAFVHGAFGWLYLILWACGVTASRVF